MDLATTGLATITRNDDLGEGWFLLEAHAPELAPKVRAGQFVQVRVTTGDDPLVRRPFSVSDVLPQPGPGADRVRLLYQVVGPGTRSMQRFAVGDPIDLLGPLGKPLPRPEIPEDGLLLLVGGGIGVAPLHLYCRELAFESAPPPHRVLLGARRRSLLVGWEAFQELGADTAVSTDDGSAGHAGNVVDLAKSHLDPVPAGAAAGIGCGPHGMNVALRDLAIERDIPFWISLENYMPCGFGACFGCVIPTPDGTRYRRVCVEGPAFPVSELPAEF